MTKFQLYFVCSIIFIFFENWLEGWKQSVSVCVCVCSLLYIPKIFVNCFKMSI